MATVAVKVNKQKLTAAVAKSKASVTKIEKVLDAKVGHLKASEISSAYVGAAVAVGKFLGESDGIRDGSSPVSRISLKDWEGKTRNVTLPRPWASLSEKYHKQKKVRGFWRQRGEVYQHYNSSVVARASAKVKVTSQLLDGGSKLTAKFTFALPSLPTPYNRLIRGPFVRGFNKASVTLVPPPVSGGVRKGDRNPPNRVLLPEGQRPLVAPIAHRMGQTLSDSLKRRK